MGQASLGGRVETVVNCFKHCGFQPTTTEDPFVDLDQHDEELEELVQQLGPDMPLTTTEYVAADEDVATCATFENSANWRQELRGMVVSDGIGSKMPAIVEDEEEEESDEELPADTITTYDEAIRCGNDLLAFLTRENSQGFIQRGGALGFPPPQKKLMEILSV